MNSASRANLVACTALASPLLGRPLQPGDEVITTAMGFPITLNPILQNGCTPVFVDVDLETGDVDVFRLEDARGERTRAVVLAHTLDNPFDLGTVLDFYSHHGLYLIEDNCDPLVSRYLARPTGTFGDFGNTSFYAPQPPHHYG